MRASGTGAEGGDAGSLGRVGATSRGAVCSYLGLRTAAGRDVVAFDPLGEMLVAGKLLRFAGRALGCLAYLEGVGGGDRAVDVGGH